MTIRLFNSLDECLAAMAEPGAPTSATLTIGVPVSDAFRLGLRAEAMAEGKLTPAQFDMMFVPHPVPGHREPWVMPISFEMLVGLKAVRQPQDDSIGDTMLRLLNERNELRRREAH